MIAEALIAGLTVCFIACLRFARYAIDRSDPLAEKRRILERRREELHAATCSTIMVMSERQRAAGLKRDVDEQLLALANELK